MQYRLRRHDGAYHWIDDIGIPRYARDGTFLGYIGSCSDITHLREAEAATQEGERRLRFALEAAKMGTFEVDIAATRALIDAQEARLLGLPADTQSVSVDEMRKRIPFEDLQASDAKQSRLTDGAQAYHHEFRLLMPDGSERWLSGHADIRFNRIFGVNFDITERKRAEEALRDSEARLRIATNGTGLGVFEWDPETDHAVWENDRLYEIFGRIHAEGPVSKRHFVDNYLHPGDVHTFENALNEARRTGGPFDVVCRIKWKDGSRRWLRIHGRFAVVVKGGSSRLVGVVADITSSKRLERRAERNSQRLATVQEKERRNIAQELHNSTVQHLVAAGLCLTLVKPKSPTPGEATALWSSLESSLDEAMKELRTFSYLLHPPAMGARTLRSTVEEYVAGLASRSGLNIELRLNSKVEMLPLPMKRLLFRIVQAALANVYRHALASQTSVEFRWIGTGLHLTITDNGRGLERRAPLRPGVGLRGIGARLDDVGGNFRIIQIKPHGTMVHAVIPVGNDLREASRGTANLDWSRDCPDHGLACPREGEIADCSMRDQFRCKLGPLST